MIFVITRESFYRKRIEYLLRMIECLRTVVKNSHYVWIIVLVIIVERIENDSKAVPLAGTTENSALVGAFISSVPEC